MGENISISREVFVLLIGFVLMYFTLFGAFAFKYARLTGILIGFNTILVGLIIGVIYGKK